MTLRRTFCIALGLLGGVGVVVAVLLITLTTLLHHTVDLLRTSLESVRVAQEVEKDLLAHSRASNLHYATGEGAALEARDRSAAAVRGNLELAHQHVSTPDEQRAGRPAGRARGAVLRGARGRRGGAAPTR